VSTADQDPVVRQYRDQITDNDLKIIDAINKRLKLVSQLKSYKDTHGIDFVDADRERWMITYAQRANKGPLSQDGLAHIYTAILSLTKSELSGN
jgi:chorismate mutase